MQADNITVCPGGTSLSLGRDSLVHVLTGVFGFTVLTFALLGIWCLRKYRSLVRTTRELQARRPFPALVPRPEAPAAPVMSQDTVADVEHGDDGDPPPRAPLRQSSARRPSSRRPSSRRPSSRGLWKGTQPSPCVSRSDLTLLQLIKSGKEGVFYQARMSRGTCKGHNLFTCKISKQGVRSRHVDLEVSIMRKLVHHKNVLQLLDWSTAEEPYILVMEYVSYGTLRTFLQTNRSNLSADPELQSLLTIASYHVALAMQHLRSKMIVHCDLALRNVMVNNFPWEVKVAEFGLARDLSTISSRRSSRWRKPPQRVPLRWYPPEYFKSNCYSFRGDVWAFGIVLWEMQMFGILPYPNLETSEAVVYHICIGHKNANPEGCRPEILHIMQDCWLEPYNLRPSFADIVPMLENIMENDADYVDVGSPQLLVSDEAEYHKDQ